MIFKVGQDNDAKDIFVTGDMGEGSHDPYPEYLKSVAGNPQRARTISGIDAKVNLFKIVQVVEKDLRVISGSGTLTIKHQLGYQPFVVGSYVVKDGTVGVGLAYPNGLRGMIPENRVGEYGGATLHQVYVGENNNSYLTVIANMTALEGLLSIKLQLLRESMI